MIIPQSGELPPFPRRTIANGLSITPGTLRPATLCDLAFLRQLYHSFRTEELAQVTWPPQEKIAFLDQQFNFQHRSYVAAFPQADFLIIETDGTPIGRLYIDLGADIWHIIDIGLLPEWRGRGIGVGILKGIKAAAIAGGSPGIFLHVDRANGRARKLYQAAGFSVADTTETHIGMQWRSHPVLSETADGRSGVN